MTIEKRNLLTMQCLAYLYSSMGAVIEDTRVLWWPIVQVSELLHQVVSRKPMDILAGYMSKYRGLHWNRKRD